MKKEDLLKSLTVVATNKGYYGGRIQNEGNKFVIQRVHFSPSWMLALDSEGKIAKEQPSKVNTKEARKVLDLDKKKNKANYKFPLLGKHKREALEAHGKSVSTEAGTTVTEEEVTPSQPVAPVETPPEPIEPAAPVETNAGQGAQGGGTGLV